MNWFNKHVDTVIVMGGILASILWMNHKFSEVEKDLVVIKTVMIMKGIMPDALASKEKAE